MSYKNIEKGYCNQKYVWKNGHMLCIPYIRTIFFNIMNEFSVK